MNDDIENSIYDIPNTKSYRESDLNLTKRNKYASGIMTIKAISTLPFYFTAIYEPFYLEKHSWILYIEALNHFHTRIFFLIAIYRGILQLYFSSFSNGYCQKQFIIFEMFFDMSVIVLYLHEHIVLENIKELFSNFFIFHLITCFTTFLNIILTCYIKIDHVG